MSKKDKLFKTPFGDCDPFQDNPIIDTKLISINEAITQAKTIQNRYPDRCLCGSVALIISGAYSKTHVHDIDFVTMENPKKTPLRYLNMTSSHPYQYDSRYTHLEMSHPYQHCLFIFEELKIEKKRYQGLMIQDIEQILYWKNEFGREKDSEDLNLIKIEAIGT